MFDIQAGEPCEKLNERLQVRSKRVSIFTITSATASRCVVRGFIPQLETTYILTRAIKYPILMHMQQYTVFYGLKDALFSLKKLSLKFSVLYSKLI